MKFFLLISLFSVSIFSQKPNDGLLQFTFDSNYVPAEITFKDGHSEVGFIYGFIENRFFEVNPAITSGFETIENNVNLDDAKFDFKSSLDSKVVKLTNDDINKVIIKKEEEIVEYHLLPIKTVNVNSEIVDLKKRIWLPLIKNDKVSIYGYNYFMKYNGAPSQYMMTTVYLKNKNENYAIPPLDYNRINLMNLEKVDDKYRKAINEVFKDCPEFISKLDVEKVMSKEEKKSAIDKYYADKKELKNLTKGMSKSEKKIFEINYYQNKTLEPYVKLIDEYVKACPN